LILSYPTLLDCWQKKKIRFKPDIDESQIGESSIDLRLGKYASRLVKNESIIIEPAFSNPEGLYKKESIKDSLIINPKELVLVSTMENVTLPADLCASVEGRSSYARFGLAAHITSPHINPSWDGQITLELYNHNPNRLKLSPGERVCQLIISQVTEPIPTNLRGKSRYQHQQTTEPQRETAKSMNDQ
jgi:dCTP deaminase